MAAESQDKLRYVKELGAGSFGTCKLAIDLDGEYVAVKFIPRGRKVDKNVMREVLVHSQLHHPNVVGFKRVFLTQTHLCLVLEYASAGELFESVRDAGRFDEDMARFFFQQLIAGVHFCHKHGVSHRDLKLENTLLKHEVTQAGCAPIPVLKIADFGFCKHEALHTPPDSKVGTPAYISPEVLQAPQQYDGKAADVWSCGVHLYIMLVGWYPFTDPRDPKNFPKTAQCINDGHFTYPPDLQLSVPCQQLIRRMLEKDPRQRITIAEVQRDPWFLKNLSRELMDDCSGLPHYKKCQQSLHEIKKLLEDAKRTV